MGSFVVGFVAAVFAAVFWGSNYVVVKNYNMGDGLVFQLLLCVGIMLMGLLSLFSSPIVGKESVEDFDSFPFPDYEATFSTEGLVGGIVWCCGNLLTVPILNSIGLGIGQSVWAGQSVLVSFIFGRMEIFGLEPDELSNSAAAYVGLIFGLSSLLVFSRIETKTAVVSEIEESLIEDTDIALEPEGFDSDDDDVSLRINEHDTKKDTKRGLLMAIIAGTLYGFQFVPLQIHSNQYKKPDDVSSVVYSMRFFFSQFAGIFLSSCVAFAIYVWRMGNKPMGISNKALLPSVFSGMIWSMGTMCGMVATAEMGLSVGYPLSANMCFLVNGTWSIFIFKEVQGRKNLSLYALAGLMNIVSSILLSISR